MARHVLTSGLDRLAAAGCETLMITYLENNPVSQHLYLSTGFQPQRPAAAIGDRSSWRLLGCLGMSRHGIGEPDGSPTVIDAIPEPTAARYFVLPLFKLLAVHDTRTQVASKRMLPAVPLPRVHRDSVPGDSSVCRRDAADGLPAVDCLTRGIPELPSSRTRWRGYPFAALRHLLVLPLSGSRNGRARCVDLQAKPVRQDRIGIDLSGCTPLANELA